MFTPFIPESIANLSDLLLHRASSTPDKIAYRFLDGNGELAATLSYGELARESERVATTLQELDVFAEPVLLVFDAGLEFLSAFFGVLRAGAIAVPVCPPRRTTRRNGPFQAIAAQSGARLALTSRALLDDPVRQLRAYAPDMQWLCAAECAGGPGRPLSQQPIALLQYTSGSTRGSRGTIITHDNILDNERMIAVSFGQTDQTVFVGWLPHYHDMGLIGNLLQPFSVGGTCIFMAPESFVQKPVLWLDAITRYRGTTAGGPNFAFDLCNERIDREHAQLDLRSWELAFVGAEPIQRRTLDRFCDRFARFGFARSAFYPCYGLAEATLFVSGGAKGDGYDQPAAGAPRSLRDLVGCGRSWGTEIKIVDPETGEPRGASDVGEIWLRGRSVAQGYWRDPESTAETFPSAGNAAGWLRTGDLGSLQDGQLSVVGRLKNVVIVAGKNYFAEDIEHIVSSSCRACEAVAAFGVASREGERLALVCELERQAERQDFEQLAADIRGRLFGELNLAAPLIVFVRTRSMPRTTSGKLKRFACREALLRGELTELGRSQLAKERDWLAETEAWLVDSIAGRSGLPRDQVKRETPFPALGLESRDLLAIGAELGNRLAVELDAALLWEYPSVGELVDYLEREMGDRRGEGRAP
jgi:acyl-CoA synthetase (AMP-forming)/AMP-acid ligase II/acyl carrier protein